VSTSMTGPVRVRFAPSPTGRTHLGSGRTARYTYLLAKQTGGQFILRIEDTDQKRYVPEAEAELIASLRWLGLDWDEGPDVGGPNAPYHQAERKEIYRQFARQLVAQDRAYYCFCTPERLAKVRQEQQRNKLPVLYDGTCRRLGAREAQRRVDAGERHVIRFKMPREGAITVCDLLRGEIRVENRQLDDYILVKSDGLALYHLAAMVDDHLMGITHVIRGAEWLSTFPLHGHILRAFGWQEPIWVHLSIFLKPSGKGKMSKRESEQLLKDGYSIFLNDLQKLGYIPEAVVNWVALMGWSYDDHTEFLCMQDLIDKFSLERLNPSPAAINFTKFDHFNGLHIRHLTTNDLASRLKPFLERAGYPVEDHRLAKVAPIVQERIVTLEDAVSMAGFFFKDEIAPDPAELVGKDLSAAQSADALRAAYQLLVQVEEFTVEAIEQPMRLLVEELGLKPGQLFGILRVAITGQTVSPPLFESMVVIGREKILERVGTAIQILEKLK
jgi:glutamyl-tRNA synthetase